MLVMVLIADMVLIDEDMLVLLAMIEEYWYRNPSNWNTTVLPTKTRYTVAGVAEHRGTIAIRKWVMAMLDTQSTATVGRNSTPRNTVYIYYYTTITVFNRLKIIE